MITDYQSNAYRISYQGVSMIENALENPNLIQVGVVQDVPSWWLRRKATA